MKSRIAIVLLALASSAQGKALIDPAIVEQLKDHDTVSVIVSFSSTEKEVTVQRYNGVEVLGALKGRVERSWDRLKDHLNQKSVGRIETLDLSAITHSVFLKVDRDGLRSVADAPNVEKIYFDAPVPFNEGLDREDVSAASYPYDYKEVELDQVIQAYPNIDGSGIVVGSVDTGVEEHSILKGKILHFYNAVTGSTGTYYDAHGHGTHTIGTMIGGDRSSTFVGMAPGAKAVSAYGLVGTTTSQLIKAMEFMLDPDQDPATDDHPRVVNNSWGWSRYVSDVELAYRAIEAWEAAGILPVFAAGNSGPSARTVGSPADHPKTIAVGATDENGKLAYFSSVGPGRYQGTTETQKPDLTAPGVNIVSSIKGDRMSKMSGTSMAAPHIAGISALMFQVNPKLTPAEAKALILSSVYAASSTIPAGTWNDHYGLGKSSALIAVDQTLQASSESNKMDWMSSVLPNNWNSSFAKIWKDLASQPKTVTLGDLDLSFDNSKVNWIQASEL